MRLPSFLIASALLIAAAPPLHALGCSEVIGGVLDPDDPRLSDGTWVDEYGFSLAVQTSVVITVRAQGFESYVILSDQQGNTIDEGASPLFVTLAAGEYIALANNFARLPDGSYPYEIALSCADVEAHTIRCGETIAGQLDPGDDDYIAGTWIDAVIFSLSRPTTVTFDLMADEVEPYVFVTESDGVTIDEGFPPFVIDLFPGEYFVFANNFIALQDGIYPYFLSMQCEAECAGDCNGDGDVTIDELIRGVGIALGTAAADQCLAIDSDAGGSVTVNELVQAVNAALHGCG